MTQSETQANLTEHDKTRFLERGFTVVENAGHSLRLIKRDDARQAISIKWEDLPALRELITLALDDGPMVIGLDLSGQSAQNAATQMRDACVATLRQIAADYDNVAQPNNGAAISKQAVLYAARQVESLTLAAASGGLL